MSTIEEILKSKPINDPWQRAMLGVMYTGYWLGARVNTLLKPFGITEPQFNVLRILRGQNGTPISVNSIQDRMVQPSSNVSRIIDKLIEKNYVSRTICKDNKRQVDILITPPGLQILEDIEPAMQANAEAMKRAISTEDADCLSRYLDALRNTAD